MKSRQRRCAITLMTKGIRVHPLSRRVITKQSKLGAYNVVDAYEEGALF